MQIKRLVRKSKRVLVSREEFDMKFGGKLRENRKLLCRELRKDKRETWSGCMRVKRESKVVVVVSDTMKGVWKSILVLWQRR